MSALPCCLNNVQKGTSVSPAFAHYPTSASLLVTVAEIVNDLEPHGRLYCASRGKELVFGVGEVIVRVHFAMEGHCFWMPTEQFRAITNTTPVAQGEWSKAFKVSPELVLGPGNDCLISIQAAFVRPKYTLVFCDHNVQMVFHVMLMKRCQQLDFEVGSEVWPYLWSMSHGPDPYIEISQWRGIMEAFRSQMRRSDNEDKDVQHLVKSNLPIYGVVKTDPLHFNGLGAQEACDLLIRNFIHPLLPTWVVCSSDELWNRLITCIPLHFETATKTALKIPNISSDAPLRMMDSQHKKFIISSIFCYKRSRVYVEHEWLDKAQDYHLFDVNAVLDRDGKGRLPEDVQSLTTLPSGRIRSKKTHIPNQIFHYKPPPDVDGKNVIIPFKVYCPFTVQINPTWRKDLKLTDEEPEWIAIPPQEDVENDLNSTTIGPYSFLIFVQNSWTPKRVNDSNLVNVLKGRRATVKVDRFRLRRPVIMKILQSDQKKGKKSKMRKKGKDGKVKKGGKSAKKVQKVVQTRADVPAPMEVDLSDLSELSELSDMEEVEVELEVEVKATKARTMGATTTTTTEATATTTTATATTTTTTTTTTATTTTTTTKTMATTTSKDRASKKMTASKAKAKKTGSNATKGKSKKISQATKKIREDTWTGMGFVRKLRT
ncbi:fatty acid synthase alpha subunit Lsd1 [Marasmius crinis-equi]|uniref:Fatty acid synthase alpha subunit Lsd1 n=1 Tax=Marasmius crinis-equi TaxID=585013 RepID=A0ABR3EUF1_9AGAR